MNNLVLSPRMEEKLARLVIHAEEARDGHIDGTHQLNRDLDDPEIQNWLMGLQRAGRAPSKRFAQRR